MTEAFRIVSILCILQRAVLHHLSTLKGIRRLRPLVKMRSTNLTHMRHVSMTLEEVVVEDLRNVEALSEVLAEAFVRRVHSIAGQPSRRYVVGTLAGEEHSQEPDEPSEKAEAVEDERDRRNDPKEKRCPLRPAGLDFAAEREVVRPAAEPDGVVAVGEPRKERNSLTFAGQQLLERDALP